MQNLIDTAKNEAERLLSISAQLTGYANSFRNVGNEKVSTDLYDIAAELIETQKNFQQAVYKEIDSQFKQSQQSSANILCAALAGVKLGKHEKDFKKKSIKSSSD